MTPCKEFCVIKYENHSFNCVLYTLQIKYFYTHVCKKLHLSSSWAQLLQALWFTGITCRTFLTGRLGRSNFHTRIADITEERKKKQKPPFGTFKPVTSMYLMLESKGVEDEYSQLMGAVINPILCTFLDRGENTVSQNSSCIYSRLCLQSWNNYPDLGSTKCQKA